MQKSLMASRGRNMATEHKPPAVDEGWVHRVDRDSLCSSALQKKLRFNVSGPSCSQPRLGHSASAFYSTIHKINCSQLVHKLIRSNRKKNVSMFVKTQQSIEISCCFQKMFQLTYLSYICLFHFQAVYVIYPFFEDVLIIRNCC